jgi:putative addiction module component (TIGR02574 family)
MKLDPADRERLAEDLLLSIDDEAKDEIDAAWLKIVRRRDTAFRAGKSKAHPVDEVIKRLQSRSRS